MLRCASYTRFIGYDSLTIILSLYNLILSFLYSLIYILLIHLTSYADFPVIHASPSFYDIPCRSMHSHTIPLCLSYCSRSTASSYIRVDILFVFPSCCYTISHPTLLHSS